jgi:multidrug efflux pump subunit AcrA (membrane-fusion protein)
VEARLAAARARREVLEGSAVGELETIEIDAPIDGILRAMHVASGQMVSSGALLFDVLDTSRLWVRVPVYVGEAGEVCAELPARAEGLELQPIAAPPTADPLGVTLDLYYAVDNPSGRLIPDQSLLVELTLKTPAEEDTVPSSALVRDTSGGTWIYARTGPGRYERRRVLVDRTVDGLAVLSRGPEPGTEAVIAGAAELFGTEFFVSK